MNDDDTLDEILLDIARAPELSLAGNAVPVAGAAPTAALPLIDGFELQSLIGRGGMGVVYKARQLETERLVAVKVVDSRFTGQGHELRRFDREVKTLGRLRHPRIAPLFAAGRTAEGQPFFAMELVDGITLDRFTQSAPELETRLELFLQVCDAVAYSHQFGVIHRDLKPGNILVDPTNRGVKLLDFGLARVIEPDGENTETMTRPQALQGTLPYMSPEQARGQAIATLSDVYSLGVILYELVAGRRPYEVPESLLDAITVIGEQQPKAPSHFAPRGTPRARDLDAIVLKALEKEPSRRYQSVAELAQDIENYRARRPVQPRRIRSRIQRVAYRSGLFCRRHFASVLLAAIAAMLVIGVLGWSYGRVAKSEADSRKRLAELYTELGRQHLVERNSAKALAFLAESYQLGDTRPTTRFLLAQAKRTFYRPVATIDAPQESGTSLTFSPDGSRLVTADWGGHIAVLDSPSGRLIRKLEHATPGERRVFGSNELLAWPRMAEFSRDGQRLITRARSGNAKVWDVTSGRLLRSLGSEGALGTRIVPDGSAVVVAIGNRAEVWNPENGQRVSVIEVGLGPLSGVSVSLDGSRVMTQAGEGAYGGPDDVRLWDAATGRFLASFDGLDGHASSGNFTRDGSLFVARTRDGLLQVRDASTGSLVSEIRPPLPLNLPDRITLSQDGSRLVTSGFMTGIRALDPRTGGVLAVYREQATMMIPPVFSPDDSLLAIPDGEGRVTLFDSASGQELATLESQSGGIYGLAFSPDGKWLATSAEDKKVRIWRVQIEAPVATLTGGSSSPSSMAFSPDGRRLLVLTPETGKYRVWEVAKGDMSVPLSQVGRVVGAAAAFSPDGERVAAPGKPNFVDIWDARTGALLDEIKIDSTDPWQSTAYSPNGDKLLALSRSKVCVWNVKAQRLESCSTAPREGLLSHAISSPDGSQLLAFETWSPEERAWWVEAGEFLSSHGFHWGRVLPLYLRPFANYGMSERQRRVFLVDALSGQSVEIAESVATVMAAIFSPHGSQLALRRMSGRIELRDTSNGKVQAIAQVTDAIGMSMAFSRDGTRLAIGTLGGIDFLSTATGVRLASVRMRSDPILRAIAQKHPGSLLPRGRSLLFSPDGSKLAMELSSGAISIWDVGLESLSPEETLHFVRCEVPWRLEKGQLTQIVPDAAECADQGP